jgi:hypothetical protein
LRRVLAAVLFAIVAINFLVIAAFALRPTKDIARSLRSNERHLVVALRGSQHVDSHQFDPDADNSIRYGVHDGAPLIGTHATWRLNTRALAPLAANAAASHIVLFVYGFRPHSNEAASRLTLLVNGRVVRRINFNRVTYVDGYREFHSATPLGSVRLSTSWRVPAVIADVPLVDVRGHATTDVEIRTTGDFGWLINTVGLAIDYWPRPAAVLATPIGIALGLIETLALVAGVFATLWHLGSRKGWLAAAAACAVLVLAMLSQDPWDVSVWQHIVDIPAFGAGTPAYGWSGTPLWAYLLGMLAPMPAAFLSVFHWSPVYFTVVVIKVILALSFILGVDALTDGVGSFSVSLLSPFPLYLLSWGVRDLLSASFAVFGIALFRRDRLYAAAAVFAAAASIDEYYVPLLIAPALLLVSRSHRNPRTLLSAVGTLALGGFTLAIQWLTLPQTYTSSVVSFRTSWRFTEWTWQGLLARYGLLPSFVADHRFPITLAIAVVISVVSIALCVGPLADRLRKEQQDPHARVLLAVFGCVGAFFLAYGQVDPQEWLAVFTLGFVTSQSNVDVRRGIVVLSLLATLELYVHTGLRSYASPVFFEQAELSVLGIRGDVDSVIIFGSIIGIVVLLLRSLQLIPRMTGERTGTFVTLIGIAMVSQGRGWIPTDDVFIVAAVLATAAILTALRPDTAISALPWLASAGVVAVTAYGPGPLATVARALFVVLLIVMFLAYRSALSPMDLVLGFTAGAVVATRAVSDTGAFVVGGFAVSAGAVIVLLAGVAIIGGGPVLQELRCRANVEALAVDPVRPNA